MFGLLATRVIDFLVAISKVPARVLFGWLGMVPIVGGFVFLADWMYEKREEVERARTREVFDES